MNWWSLYSLFFAGTYIMLNLISKSNALPFYPFTIQALRGDCGFMAANMYAKSIFGEDALANLSIEKPATSPDATVTGHIRIRAKSQVRHTVKPYRDTSCPVIQI